MEQCCIPNLPVESRHQHAYNKLSRRWNKPRVSTSLASLRFTEQERQKDSSSWLTKASITLMCVPRTNSSKRVVCRGSTILCLCLNSRCKRWLEACMCNSSFKSFIYYSSLSTSLCRRDVMRDATHGRLHACIYSRASSDLSGTKSPPWQQSCPQEFQNASASARSYEPHAPAFACRLQGRNDTTLALRCRIPFFVACIHTAKNKC